MSSLNAEADVVQRGIFFRATGGGTLSIICNWCSSPHHIIFEGSDTEAANLDTHWLAEAITHLLKEHPEKMEMP